MIETRLAVVLDRTNRLRATLHDVGAHSPPNDTRINQCIRMGRHAQAEAEKLTSNVEELLRSHEAAVTATPGALRSDAQPAGSAAQP
jgi:hypothetical protein